MRTISNKVYSMAYLALDRCQHSTESTEAVDYLCPGSRTNSTGSTTSFFPVANATLIGLCWISTKAIETRGRPCSRAQEVVKIDTRGTGTPRFPSGHICTTLYRVGKISRSTRRQWHQVRAGTAPDARGSRRAGEEHGSWT